MMDSLFAKIDAIQPDQQPLPDPDQNAMYSLKTVFARNLEDLNRAKEILNSLPDDSRWLVDQAKRLKEKLPDERRACRTELVHGVAGYFNDQHDLGLDAYVLQEKTEGVPDGELSDRLVELVLEQLQGRSFLDLATDQLRTELKKNLWGGVKRSRSTVTFQNYFRIEESYSGGKHLDFRSKDDVFLLFKVITRFERNTTSPAHTLLRQVRELIDTRKDPPFGEPQPTNQEKLTAYTLYKNGNVKLSFNSEASAQAFTTFYELQLKD